MPDNGGKKTMRLYFSHSAAVSIPGWVNVPGPVTGNRITKTDATTSWGIDNVGSTSTYWNPFSGSNSADTLGMTTSNNSGVIPDIALRGYWFNYSTIYTSGTNNLIITGLNPSKTYTLKLVGSRSSSNSATAPRYSSWHINNGSEILLNAYLNTANQQAVTNVTPDANGKIYIGVYRPSNSATYGSYSYINSLIVQEN